MSKNRGLNDMTDRQLRKALAKRQSQRALCLGTADAETLRALEHRIYQLMRLAQDRGLDILTDEDVRSININVMLKRAVSVDMEYYEDSTTISNRFGQDRGGGSSEVHVLIRPESDKLIRKLRHMHPEMHGGHCGNDGIDYGGHLGIGLDDGSVLTFDLADYPLRKCEKLQDIVNRACGTGINVRMS